MDKKYEDNGWEQWKLYIVKELERINDQYKCLEAKIDKILQDVAMLNVKSGIWGAIGGMIPMLVIIFIYLFIKK